LEEFLLILVTGLPLLPQAQTCEYFNSQQVCPPLICSRNAMLRVLIAVPASSRYLSYLKIEGIAKGTYRNEGSGKP
jgi:hypothetical protein